jgi:tetratricopeptide (TPR) repeat protein
VLLNLNSITLIPGTLWLYITKKKSNIFIFKLQKQYNFHNIRNYNQAIKCYMQAGKNDLTNYNVWRDLSYLQLYLRQYQSFTDSARKALDIRPNLLVNWATYAFACYMVINFIY